jgi:glycine dehydrogenase subunit 1
MAERERPGHPYIPNSAPAVKAAMLDEIHCGSIEELYADIPESLRFRGRMNIPPALAAESQLRQHVEAILTRNTSCAQATNSWEPAATTTMCRPSATKSAAAASS